MRNRQLGRTGFEVSEISLGTVEIGMSYGIAENGDVPAPDEAASSRLLNTALDLGVNFIDTARAYGESEAIIGRALRSRRREFVLTSKVLSLHGQDLPTAEVQNRTTDSVRESLRLLQTDHIDLMMIHCRATEVLPDQTVFETLEKLRQTGSIQRIGASVYGEEAAIAAMEHGGYDCLQIAYSVLDRRFESRALAVAKRTGVGLVARSVLLKGALTHRHRYLSPALSNLKTTIQHMEALATLKGMTLPELAYRYVVSQSAPETALVGAANIDELKQAIDFAGRGPLSDDQIAAVRAISMPDPADLNPGNWPGS
jgi:aryl-alcohol dehydrogenase-like predicted oxidoreductase